MQSEVIKEKKLVCIWLTISESNDPAVQALLKAIYQKYKATKYTVIVFRSGKEELCGLTSELLRYNRRLTAEREVKESRSK